MKVLVWTLRVAVLLLLVGFAARNSDPVRLRYFLGYEWHAPLSLVMLSCFAVGVLIGLVATAGTLFRLKREVARAKRAREPVSDKHATPSGEDLSTTITAGH